MNRLCHEQVNLRASNTNELLRLGKLLDQKGQLQRQLVLVKCTFSTFPNVAMYLGLQGQMG